MPIVNVKSVSSIHHAFYYVIVRLSRCLTMTMRGRSVLHQYVVRNFQRCFPDEEKDEILYSNVREMHSSKTGA